MIALLPRATDRTARAGLRRLPAAGKMGAALGLVLITLLIPAGRPAWHAILAAALMTLVALGRVPVVPLLRRLALLSPFVMGVALAAAWQPAGTISWQLLARRSALCLTTVILLAQTTSFGEILGVLRRARVHALLLTTLALMERYLYVVADERERMQRARASRTFAPGRSIAWWTAASVVGRLFVRASERAERVHDAMTARGWQ